MMLGEVVAKVRGTLFPENAELFLLHSVLYPVETHVHCFGFALADGSVGDASCGRIICLQWSGRLGMAHFFESGAEGHAVARIVEEAGEFGFGGGGHDVFENTADGMDGAVVGRQSGGRFGGIRRQGTEEEMAADPAACFGLGEVGGVAADPEDHVAGVVADGGISMGSTVI